MQSLYVYDGTGNPTALLTSGAYTAFAYDYDPYGVPTLTTDSGGNGTSQNPYTFKAGIQGRVTGWVKYGQRWYNPALGRWTQQDTLDTPLNPKNANRYAFAGCDAINNSDPTGRAIDSATAICIGSSILTFVAFAGFVASSAAASVATGGAAAVQLIGAGLGFLGTIGSGLVQYGSCNP